MTISAGLSVEFVTRWFPIDNWYEKDIYATTSDGGDAYTHDQQFLSLSDIHLSLKSEQVPFDGSDGRRYQNKLCFDDSVTVICIRIL